MVQFAEAIEQRRRFRVNGPGAVIVLRPGAKVTADELALHVKARLAGFMVPTHIWFRSEPLPRNPQGKVLKRQLRDELVPASD